MTVRSSVADGLVRGIRYSLIVVFAEGLRRRNPGAIVNTSLAFAASFLPGVIERRYNVEFQPWQRVYAVTALFTHAIGMLGPYDNVGWWDHFTHVYSATLLGGFVHAAARRRGRDPQSDVLVAVIVVGILWELIEYTIHSIARRLDFEPVLVAYGQRDTVLDLVFNLFGAILVLAFGDRFLQNFIQRTD